VIYQKARAEQLVEARERISAILSVQQNIANDWDLVERWLDKNHQVIKSQTEKHIAEIRSSKTRGIEQWLQAFPLKQKEGMALMQLAEALLRIPDSKTATLFLHDVLQDIPWREFKENSLQASFSRLGMKSLTKIWNNVPILSSLADPVAMRITKQMIHKLGAQFVMGETTEKALNRVSKESKKQYLYTFDCLGEAARSEAQAEKFFQSYSDAIDAIISRAQTEKISHSLSIKLSALTPEFRFSKQAYWEENFLPRLVSLCKKAKAANVSITLDAEESYSIEAQLWVLNYLLTHQALIGWNGLGLAVQAYLKASVAIIDYLALLAIAQNCQIFVRLVKGAYWDGEIKHAQQLGLSDYPVWTNKAETDMNYLLCAMSLQKYSSHLQAQFATHNAYTVAAIAELFPEKNFEYQRLHGMGEALYEEISKNYPVRVYAPIGSYEELLPYLIRRLLENGASQSFVNSAGNSDIAVADITKMPKRNNITKKIPLPCEIYFPQRANSSGLDLWKLHDSKLFETAWRFRASHQVVARTINNKETRLPMLGGKPVLSPYAPQQVIGRVYEATRQDAEKAISSAHAAFFSWSESPIFERSKKIRQWGHLLEKNAGLFYSLLIREAGKTWSDAHAELREAIDFCYYYASEAERLQGSPLNLPGYAGEENKLFLRGRGVFLCISPWNFPLAIFVGQIAAALAAGNTVVAKPAEHTPLVAYEAILAAYEAGIAHEVLHYLPGDGETLGQWLIGSNLLAGVSFTGSTETAKIIQKQIAKNDGAIPVFIAETGGQNAMIIDSSANIERAVDDVIISAFGSAGQRCSALRLLYIQEEIKTKFLKLLSEAMLALRVGIPEYQKIDIGPVIDLESAKNIHAHIAKMKRQALWMAAAPLLNGLPKQSAFVAPHAFLLEDFSELKQEIFGPVLHIKTYKSGTEEKICIELNAKSYGLTFGIHTRCLHRAARIKSLLRVGNIYVNRSMTGAVVGTHPFGGEGLSGTGPKAGGPFTLLRYMSEQTYSVNSTAIGGNFELMI
jgi:RHH-type proline utilization regulon transcriptional repressor/proline dehydrogenase/delta 1-pyrroline-5-carboxylate dehydrogenase